MGWPEPRSVPTPPVPGATDDGQPPSHSITIRVAGTLEVMEGLLSGISVHAGVGRARHGRPLQGHAKADPWTVFIFPSYTMSHKVQEGTFVLLALLSEPVLNHPQRG